MPTELSVEAAGVTLTVRSWAAEESPGCAPVVLLPATGETAEDWDTVASALCHPRTVHAVNLRGHGRSDWLGTYSIGLMAQDVTRLMNSELGRVPIDLVGHSLGGLLQPRPTDPPPKPTGVLPFDWRMIEQGRRLAHRSSTGTLRGPVEAASRHGEGGADLSH